LSRTHNARALAFGYDRFDNVERIGGVLGQLRKSVVGVDDHEGERGRFRSIRVQDQMDYSA